jgi:hypothetical protein
MFSPLGSRGYCHFWHRFYVLLKGFVSSDGFFLFTTTDTHQHITYATLLLIFSACSACKVFEDHKVVVVSDEVKLKRSATISLFASEVIVT